MAKIIAETIHPKTFSRKTFIRRIWDEILFDRPTIDKMLEAVGKLVSDSDIKSYTVAYLNLYKEKYSETKTHHINERYFSLNEDYRLTIKDNKIIKYLTFLKGSLKSLPENVVSYEEQENSERISSFNRKLTYVLSEIKSKFISQMLRSIIKVFSPNLAPTSLNFINDLMNFSRNKLYEKENILGHGSPTHEAVLTNLVRNRDWAIACEVPVYFTPINPKLATLLGHIDVLVYKDSIFYVCDYKPDQLSKASPYRSFLNSIPQIATYALVLKQMFNLKEIKCVTFNKKGAWLYDPTETLIEITEFMNNNGESNYLPWSPYLGEF